MIQGPVSQFLSLILKTLLVDHLQILTSTKELVCSLETDVHSKLAGLSPTEWWNNVYICTADIEGFYTNIPISECTSKLEDLVLEHFGHDLRSSRVKAHFVKELFSVQQDHLIFRCKVNGQWELI